MMQLRPYQEKSIAEIRQALISGSKSPMLQLPTGAGKTVIAASIAQMAAKKGKRFMFVADSIELIDQTVETFQSLGLDVGVMQGYHELTNPSAQSQIVTPQTISARLKKQRANFEGWPIDAICVDEAHIIYQAHKDLRELYPNAPFIGISATPYSKGLGLMYDRLIVGASMRELIEQKYLCPVDYFAPSTVDLEGLKTMQNGDIDPEGAAKRMTVNVVGDVVKHWKQHAADKSTIGFAPNVAASKRFAAEFEAQGVNVRHIDGYGSSDADMAYRFETVRDFKAGKIQMLWSCLLTIKGFDSPAAECMIDCQPTKSLCRFVQKAGRVMRIAPGKERALILDHCGSVYRCGLPEDASIDALCRGEKGERTDRKPKDAPQPKPCPKCDFVKEPKQHVCPNCRFAPERQFAVESIDGELIKYGEGDRWTKAQKLDWMQMFATYCRQNGKKPGYAIFLFKSKFKQEPPVKWAKKDVEPIPEVLSWIKHEQIRFAKSRAKAKKADSHAA